MQYATNRNYGLKIGIWILKSFIIIYIILYQELLLTLDYIVTVYIEPYVHIAHVCTYEYNE